MEFILNQFHTLLRSHLRFEKKNDLGFYRSCIMSYNQQKYRILILLWKKINLL